MVDTEELAKGYTHVNSTQYDAGLFLLKRLGIAPGMHVLDVGCGTGELTTHVAGLVGEDGKVVGVEPSNERLAIARETAPPNLTYRQGFAEDLSSFPASTFDIVFVNSTLHWVQDQPKALKEFARVLKPGGRVGISGGSGDFLTHQERIKEDVLSREPYRHYPEEAPPKFLKRQEIENLVDNAGFARKDIVINKIIKSTKDADGMINWLDTSSSGKTYGGIPLDLRPKAREEMRLEWDKLATHDGIHMDMELLVTVATK
ncbi:hypothetical protein PFICI_04105 [Pestalotiopsis fici W106-1]|uniref:Methyltransferase type 11 domain-containing protein n=1 Tax=Pestalotiopsis fici (strain W106-1 / CGMCC3.15140) TaxID=1229662 RepID=W3XJ85_PESFW|nr:uncharacterized protein PFICI_04105 [Pestalotiopsis fici W106-1]ETS86080.1 hypothetical protein PFICI_04105 [Pestalotiopsis fici W106-1]